MAAGLRAFRARLFRNSKIKRAQSLVEYAIILPVLLIMLSGLVEAGFALNVYLDLIDSAREAARNLADVTPFDDETGINEEFYNYAKTVAEESLGQSGQIQLDPASDNLVVSVFQVTGSGVGLAESDRFPATFSSQDGCMKGGELGWIAYCNARESKIGTVGCGEKGDCIVLKELLSGLVAPNTGMVVVEIYYDYHMTLGLPWITAFLPDDNTITLYAYSFMPNSAAEP